MLVFSGNSNKPLAQKLVKSLGLSLGELEITLFPDNENRVRVIDLVLDKDVVIVESTGIFPNLYYMQLFFTLDSFKRSGAKSITAVIPYLGYQRQDHIFRDGESVSLEVIIKILESLGVTRVVSFDLHSIKIPEFFHIEINHLSALPLFANQIKEMNEEDVTLVSPDMGGIRRADELSKLLGGKPIVSIEKNRDLYTGKSDSVAINGKVGKVAVIIDDVVSTGNTLIGAAQLLKKNGAEKVYVMVTHSILSGRASQNLQNSEIEKVITTDTIEVLEEKKFPKLEVLSVSSLIAQELTK